MNTAAMVSIQSANNAIRASQIGHSHTAYTLSQADAQWFLAMLCGALLFWILAWFRMNPSSSFGRKAFISANLSGSYVMGFLVGALLYKLITTAMGFQP